MGLMRQGNNLFTKLTDAFLVYILSLPWPTGLFLLIEKILPHFPSFRISNLLAEN